MAHLGRHEDFFELSDARHEETILEVAKMGAIWFATKENGLYSFYQNT